MKVLVTGADGFIGSHLVELLLHEGYDIKAFCAYNSFSSLGWLDALSKEKLDSIEVVLGDIRDYHSVASSMQSCDSVLHLAALIAIPYSYQAPQSYIDTNISGTLNILNVARELNISRVVHTSTSETYGSAQYVPIDESHPSVGQSPYAASKIGADQMALSFHKSFDLPVSIIRPFNTYGPRQSARAVIPTIISQVASGFDKISLGALDPTRDFNYVEDTCSAFLSILKSDATIGKAINACSNYEISIYDTAKLILDVMGSSASIVNDDLRFRPKKSEVNRLFGCNQLIKTLTPWEPKYGGLEGFKHGIIKTVEWFTDPSNLKMYKATLYNI